MSVGNDTLRFFYDASGIPVSVDYNGITYYYATNIQGDVVAILDATGVAVVEYTYDAWGTPLAISGSDAGTLGAINPLRYRGYVYDQETRLYYVSCRYYNPKTSRWISPETNVYAGRFDEGSGLLGYNVFVYCANNPVNFFDMTGEFIISTLLLCVVGGAVLGGVIGGIAGNAYADSKGYTGWNKTKCILTGAGIGGVVGAVLGYVAAPAVVGSTGVAGVSITAGGISTIAAVGTCFGKLGVLIVNNGNQFINWAQITYHGIQRMYERGVTPFMVIDWVKNGKALEQAGGKILYITKQGAVVIDKFGRIITAYTSKEFDLAMLELIKKLFGG